jgi:hypothetical protein
LARWTFLSWGGTAKYDVNERSWEPDETPLPALPNGQPRPTPTMPLCRRTYRTKKLLLNSFAATTQRFADDGRSMRWVMGYVGRDGGSAEYFEFSFVLFLFFLAFIL